ncbi:ATP-dependent helicase, partial [Persephonella sp. KM09-Lau-8]|uniref:ATP-dependent helicase n=1 Tax=Persephonella sp. KM09-Lau-8 TaxID=1158345 RepID=UPI00049692CE
MEKLTQAQQKAVTHLSTPLLVIAGAGTGKTKTITEKIKYLRKDFGIPPERILAITFTNKAAKEMKKRVEEGETFPYIKTFHSFALTILKTHPEEAFNGENFSILDEKDQLEIIRQILKEKSIEIEPRKVLNEISLFKENKKETDPQIEEIFVEYQERLLMSNSLDFDDIIIKANELLEEHEEIRNFWKESFDYILVDEFQDTNKNQLRLIKNIYKEPFITAVGDPNQCIYSWRGSEIKNILEFKKHFPGAQIIKLENNFRSTKKILHMSNVLLEGTIPEEMLPVLKSNREEGKLPVLKIFKSDTEESKAIAKKIKDLLSTYSPSDIAVLVRKNNLIPEIEKRLLEEKLPYKTAGKIKFSEKSEIKLILSYIRAVLNKKDEAAFFYCINRPARGIGKKTQEKIKNSFEKNWIYTAQKIAQTLPDKQQKAVKNFIKILETIEKEIETESANLIEKITELIDLKNYLIEKYKSKQVVGKKLKNIQILSEMLKENKSLEDFMEMLYLESGQDQIDKEHITIATIHSAKGLEFPVVFIPALEEGILPSGTDIHEELRVLYVAITRAKDLLFLSAAKYRKGFDGIPQKTKPSRFLKNITKVYKTKSLVKT